MAQWPTGIDKLGYIKNGFTGAAPENYEFGRKPGHDIMPKWRRIFESREQDPDDTRMDYVFKPPASLEEIKQVEDKLGLNLPPDVRELLSEFNGIAAIYPKADYEVGLFFTTQDLISGVPKFIEQWEDEELNELARNCVFVCHENGFGDLFGVIVNDFKELRSGEIVKIDHEMIGFGYDQFREKAFDSLEELVRNGPRFP